MICWRLRGRLTDLGIAGPSNSISHSCHARTTGPSPLIFFFFAVPFHLGRLAIQPAARPADPAAARRSDGADSEVRTSGSVRADGASTSAGDGRSGKEGIRSGDGIRVWSAAQAPLAPLLRAADADAAAAVCLTRRSTSLLTTAAHTRHPPLTTLHLSTHRQPRSVDHAAARIEVQQPDSEVGLAAADAAVAAMSAAATCAIGQLRTKIEVSGGARALALDESTG